MTLSTKTKVEVTTELELRLKVIQMSLVLKFILFQTLITLVTITILESFFTILCILPPWQRDTKRPVQLLKRWGSLFRLTEWVLTAVQSKMLSTPSTVSTTQPSPQKLGNGTSLDFSIKQLTLTKLFNSFESTKAS